MTSPLPRRYRVPGLGPALAAPVLAVVCLVSWPVCADAFPAYSVGCVDCHPGFQNRGPLHDFHVGNDRMTNTCLLCHFQNPGDFVYTYQSGAEGGQGCRGCHGVDNGTELNWGVGLRVRHDVIFGGLCGGCHIEDPLPSPESTVPVYFTRADVALKSPCETLPELGGEDWDGDGQGLDNDGDLAYDGLDSDCGPDPVGVGTRIEVRTWGRVKALYQ